jgi:DNA mismatch repair ATPase MutS
MSKTKLSTADSELSYTLDVFEFLEENDQFSNTDMLLVQLGSCQLFLSDEFENLFKGEGKKLNALLQNRENVKVNYVKNSFSKKVDEATFATKLLRIIGSATHISNIITTEYPLASICADVLISTLKLLNAVDMEKYLGKYELRIGSLQNYMRLDTAAADAVNLLPKPDHPSAYGSLFGILNRCKTKMGARLLER